MKLSSQTKSVSTFYPKGHFTEHALHAGVPFPKNFRDTVRTINRRLFRIYAHLYSNHFDQICALGIEGAPHGSIIICRFAYHTFQRT